MIVVDNMEEYQKKFAKLLAETGSLFFDKGLILKDKRPSPYFVNLGVFNTGKLNFLLGEFYADMLVSTKLVDKVDILFGPSYKGSAIANATANALWVKHKIEKKFNYDRKEMKDYGECNKGSLFVGAKFFDGCNVYLLDDVATSMRTKYDAIEKLKEEERKQGIKIKLVGIGIAVDRQQTTAKYTDSCEIVLDVKGEDAITDFTKKTGVKVNSIVGIKDVIEYIYEEQIPVKIMGGMKPINNELKTEFDEYIKTYGVD